MMAEAKELKWEIYLSDLQRGIQKQSYSKRTFEEESHRKSSDFQRHI